MKNRHLLWQIPLLVLIPICVAWAAYSAPPVSTLFHKQVKPTPGKQSGFTLKTLSGETREISPAPYVLVVFLTMNASCDCTEELVFHRRLAVEHEDLLDVVYVHNDNQAADSAS